ncbi:hypothetical protein PSOS111911_17570 [Pseudoalteromonas ostreae]
MRQVCNGQKSLSSIAEYDAGKALYYGSIHS